MKRGTFVLLTFVFVILVIFMNGCGAYNNMVNGREEVRKTWQNVETFYQLRIDKIPNLVATVQGQGDFEKSTLEAVINARASATKVTVDPTKLDAASLQQYEQAQGALSSALGRLLVVSENYPNLQTNSAFTELRAEISETENRIQVARSDYNNKAADFNAMIQRFPRNIWAGVFGFSPFPYFQADQGADKAPKVNFNFKDSAK
ncbi:MAG TPA: LemA family protein [Bacteroidia bacterium]|nr:LemA family protein [Bacteroidia bacterium]